MPLDPFKTKTISFWPGKIILFLALHFLCLKKKHRRLTQSPVVVVSITACTDPARSGERT